MKKLLSLSLSVLMMLSMGLSVFAADYAEDPEQDPIKKDTVTVVDESTIKDAIKNMEKPVINVAPKLDENNVEQKATVELSSDTLKAISESKVPVTIVTNDAENKEIASISVNPNDAKRLAANVNLTIVAPTQAVVDNVTEKLGADVTIVNFDKQAKFGKLFNVKLEITVKANAALTANIKNGMKLVAYEVNPFNGKLTRINVTPKIDENGNIVFKASKGAIYVFKAE